MMLKRIVYATSIALLAKIGGLRELGIKESWEDLFSTGALKRTK
jgi:hypothetical protein